MGAHVSKCREFEISGTISSDLWGSWGNRLRPQTLATHALYQYWELINTYEHTARTKSLRADTNCFCSYWTCFDRICQLARRNMTRDGLTMGTFSLIITRAFTLSNGISVMQTAIEPSYWCCPVRKLVTSKHYCSEANADKWHHKSHGNYILC